MEKLKVMTIVGTRPELIKLSEIIKKFEIYFNHILVHTGQNYDYELNQIFFDEMGIKEPDYYLNVVGNMLGNTIGNVISKSFELINNEKPDAIVILGDTNSCLSALSAKRLKVPIFHLEAGNRCFDENLPEEINRRIVDIISDVNLCYSEHARRNLIDSNLPADKVFVIGSPMKEILTKSLKKINSSKILSKLNLIHKNYIVFSAHREENLENHNNFQKLIKSINGIARYYKMPIVCSAHPRFNNIIINEKCEFEKNIIFCKPFGFYDYVNLQKNSFCVISDSGTLAEEAAYFKFPAISIRTSTERPEAFEKGCFVLGNLSIESILQSINLVTAINQDCNKMSEVNDYLDENISDKVSKIIQSYVRVINSFVWRKDM